MGTGLPLLLLLLGCFVAGSCGATDSPSPSLKPEAGAWLPSAVSLSCRGAWSHFLLLRDGRPDPGSEHMATSTSGLVFFTPRAGGNFTCRGGDGNGNVTSAPSNTVLLLDTDPRLPPPQLWVVPEPPQPPPEPPQPPVPARVVEGSPLALACRGPPGAPPATFRLFRGGPGGAVGGGQRVPAGGTARFTLGPLSLPDNGSYYCTYNPGGAAGGAPPPAPPRRSTWKWWSAPTPDAPTGRAAGPGLRGAEPPPRPGRLGPRSPSRMPGPTSAPPQ
ncbi:basic proline-rich protein-like isoform X2 [Dromaius novaehollandiae]|uniref:basic proline-rich protein-like isoform X2 n=1 Tax=Dromaius novaehollandiae TaxID=8790 RepID=UPI00311E8A58